MQLPSRLIEEKAKISVARGCGFACLAIVCLMVGSSINLSLSFQIGGLGLLIMSAILILKHSRLATTSFKRTEVWIMLSKEERPDEATARRLIGEILGRTYLEFALKSAKAATVLLAVSLVIGLVKGH